MSALPVGTRVRVVRGTWAKRVGVVVELPGFPWRDHRRVALDATDDQQAKTRLVEVADLRAVKSSPTAPVKSTTWPRTQLSLFGESSP